MLRNVLLILAGVPLGWAMVFPSMTDSGAIIACLVASGGILLVAWQAPERREKALEKRLAGLRIVGREEEP